MTERERFILAEKKEKIYYSRGCCCKVCKKPIQLSEAQLAHKICKSKANLRKYGPEVIHHEKNLVLVCSDKNGRCNDSCNISFNPAAVAELVAEIVDA
ncbi:hypothetical protein KAR91_69750 [Candidatus Pacearchaeota archaeon]|nr:hypothetical protein [Candidatus Pacearchaeota archaeon]